MRIFLLCLFVLFSTILLPLNAVEGQKPNILLIAIDDLNDWIGVMYGYPGVQTPNIDRLAKRGMLFENAHCQSPVCNPSRASLMSSLYPSTTGIYFLSPGPDASDAIDENDLMPRRFARDGYDVVGVGKLFHSGKQDKKYWPRHGGSFGGFGPLPKKRFVERKGTKLWDWGVYPENDADMPDVKIANYAINELDGKLKAPFLLGVGFYRPHVPLFVPQKWFDLYPIGEVKLPLIKEDDLDDVPEYGRNLTTLEHIAPTPEWVEENNQHKALIHAYLASISFVDAQVGKVLDALDQSPHADNTYIILFSDHGFHMGEKNHWAKRTLWSEAGKVPLIIAGPGITGGQHTNKPVELLDIYPTMLEMADLKPNPKHEGQSLMPLLKDPYADWPYFAMESFGAGNYAIISDRYRYIHYNDGSEEFYDMAKDPNEWDNQINNPELAALIAKHREQLPEASAPILGKNSTGHKAYRASEAAREN